MSPTVFHLEDSSVGYRRIRNHESAYYNQPLALRQHRAWTRIAFSILEYKMKKAGNNSILITWDWTGLAIIQE